MYALHHGSLQIRREVKGETYRAFERLKICLQNSEQEILNMDSMLSTLGVTIACLQKCQKPQG